MGLLGPLLNRRSELSIRNGVLLYKQLIRPLMDYVCPIWRSTARTHVRRLQVLQSKCLHLVTSAPWYLSNRQIHEDLGVPLFADHIRALIVSFDSRWTDMGNPLVRQLGRYLHWPRVCASALCISLERRGQQAGRGHHLSIVKSTKRIKHLSDALTEIFPWFFLSFKANVGALENDAKLGHGPHSPQAWRPHRSTWIVANSSMWPSQSGFKPGQPTKQSTKLFSPKQMQCSSSTSR
jgi:hypothetical protein